MVTAVESKGQISPTGCVISATSAHIQHGKDTGFETHQSFHAPSMPGQGPWSMYLKKTCTQHFHPCCNETTETLTCSRNVPNNRMIIEWLRKHKSISIQATGQCRWSSAAWVANAPMPCWTGHETRIITNMPCFKSWLSMSCFLVLTNTTTTAPTRRLKMMMTMIQWWWWRRPWWRRRWRWQRWRRLTCFVWRFVIPSIILRIVEVKEEQHSRLL